MAKKIRKNPDDDLVPYEYEKLNKEFYHEYFSQYFFIKFAVTANLIQNPTNILETINGPDNNIVFGKLEVDPFQISKKDLEIFGKLELSVMYYHCIETFLRLFLAHITIPKCPWLELHRDISYINFKKVLEKLSKDRFDLGRDDLTYDEAVCYIFTGNKHLNIKNSSEIINGLKEWVQWAAKELLEVYEYNSFKHGLVVIPEERGFKIQEKDDKIKFEKHDESLKIIYKQATGKRWVWKEKVIFTPFDFRGSCVFILQKLILNIFNVGKFTYLNEELNKIVFVPHGAFSPRGISKSCSDKVNNVDVMIKGYSMELTYFERK